jgi:hypothetical protein
MNGFDLLLTAFDRKVL